MVPGVFGGYADLLHDTTESFQDKFCRHFGVPADRFEQTMLRRTLYWHARWLRWLFPHDYLSPDRCFIASVGRLTRRRDFPGEVVEFHEDDRNLTFLRRTARLRVSSGRMRALFREVWPDSARNPASARPAVRAVHAGVSQL